MYQYFKYLKMNALECGQGLTVLFFQVPEYDDCFNLCKKVMAKFYQE